MALALFDLDETLLEGDSDRLWGEHLCAVGAIDAAAHRDADARHRSEYLAGRLDVDAFLRRCLAPLVHHPLDDLHRWRAEFVATRVLPVVRPAARDLLERHRSRGDTLLIVTATNRFVAGPIAQELGVPHLLATEPAMRDGRYTGEVDGTPCFRTGKLVHVDAWFARHGGAYEDATFYSDSHNDLPLLERVAHPVAVDPDPALARIAVERGWPVVSLRAAA